MQKEKVRSFSEVVLFILSLSYIVIGGYLMLFPSLATPVVVHEANHPIMLVCLRLIGSSYTLLGFLLFIFSDVRGIRLVQVLIFLLLIGIFNMYLSFQISHYIPLRPIYYLFESGRILLMLLVLLKAGRKSL
jgi:hypothetical protein|tara:strand:- start:289 stop:684 length:396 start_codon:yes stop_codon:yes gene_type:complete